MSSYMIIKVLSIIVMVVILIIVLVKKKSEKRDNHNDVKEISTREKTGLMEDTDTHSEDESKGKINFKAIHDEMYYVEYKLVRQLADSYIEHPEKVPQIVTTVYENLYILQNRLRRQIPALFVFENISCEILGDTSNECLAVYEYPKPIDMPLAKYGAIYFNRLEHEYKYWTFEFSEPGKYFLCSTTGEGRANYGARSGMSKEEFIHEVCQLMSVDETVFQQRSQLSRRNMLELNDSSLRDAIANCHLLAICFYDYNEPSQSLIPMLEHLADDYAGKISIGVFDVYGGDGHYSSVEDYSVHALPTLLLFVDGRVVDKCIGLCSPDALKTKFDNLLKTKEITLESTPETAEQLHYGQELKQSIAVFKDWMEKASPEEKQHMLITALLKVKPGYYPKDEDITDFDFYDRMHILYSSLNEEKRNEIYPDGKKLFEYMYRPSYPQYGIYDYIKEHFGNSELVDDKTFNEIMNPSTASWNALI